MSEIQKPGINEAIAALVAAEVSKAMAAHEPNLARLQTFLSGGVASPTASAAAKKTTTATKPGTKPAVHTAGGPGAVVAAAKYKEGEKVIYKQGRGDFPSVILEINRETGILTVKRDKDGKVIERPADKVYTA